MPSPFLNLRDEVRSRPRQPEFEAAGLELVCPDDSWACLSPSEIFLIASATEISEACAADRIESIVMWRESPWLSFSSPQPQSRHIVLPFPANWPSAPGLSDVTQLRIAISALADCVPTAAQSAAALIAMSIARRW